VASGFNRFGRGVEPPGRLGEMTMTRKVDSIIDRYNAEPAQLISVLQDIQTEYRYLPREAMLEVSRKLAIPASRVYSVATFFRAFSLKPRGKHVISVCLGTACHVRGAQRIVEALERRLAVRAGETTDDMRYTLETVNCLGACALGPIAEVDGEYFGQMTTRKIAQIFKKYR
jgi:NADH-quinone oxidoreductase subunit E